jgi:hypothetical protein
MKTTTSTPMLWTEMTDDLSETVNGGYHNCHHHCHYEKPKVEKKCEAPKPKPVTMSYYWCYSSMPKSC